MQSERLYFPIQSITMMEKTKPRIKSNVANASSLGLGGG